MRIFNYLLLTLLLSAGTVSLAQAQPKAAPAAKPKIVVKGVINGSATSLPKPAYPSDAAKAGVEGTVEVSVTIDEQGNVMSAKALSGPALLHDASVAAALQAKFNPTTLSGKPVKVSGKIVYNFVPAKAEPEKIERGSALLLLGMVFGLPEMIGELFEDSEAKVGPGTEIGQDLPDLAKEFEPLDHLKGLSAGEKTAKFIQVGASVEAKLTGTDAWYFSLGKTVVVLMGEVKKADGEDHPPNEALLMEHLNRIKQLSQTAPAGIPESLVSDMKEIGDLIDREGTAKGVQAIIKTFGALIDGGLAGKKK